MTDSTNNLSNPTAHENIDNNLADETIDSPQELNKLLDSTLTTDEKFTILHHQFSTLFTRLEKSDSLVERLRKEMHHSAHKVYNRKDETKAPHAPHTNHKEDLVTEPEGFGPNKSIKTTPHRESPKEKTTDDTSKTYTMTLWQHLEELRWVLIKTIITLIIATGIGIYFSSSVYDIIMYPVQKQIDEGTVKVFYHTPTSAFIVKFKMALLVGLILSLPFILGFIWQFISPGLKVKERNHLLLAQLIGTSCFLLGGTFGYSFLPLGLPILIEFGDPNIQQLWTLGEYVSFCIKLILAFGFVFEMPIVLGTLVRLGVVKSHTLTKARPYALIIILLVAALLTPPDVFSQLVLGIPMIILYEISIIVGRWQEKKQQSK